MYVTKSNMANAVSNLTKNLEQVTDAIAVSNIKTLFLGNYFISCYIYILTFIFV